ncbi:hypothetical protein RYX36_030102, partial [Vicia faba]
GHLQPPRRYTLRIIPLRKISAAIAESLVAFHVYSFSSFLFSGLVALALKQVVCLSRTSFDVAHVNIYVLQ